MKLICLSKGSGYYFPPCHIIETGGFRILLDCPLDLSALTVFSPVPVYSDRRLEEAAGCSCPVSEDDDSTATKRQKVEKVVDSSSLIHAVPWYKTVSGVHLWDVSLIDVVLISSPMGMLGLPFLTRKEGFSAKIYATEATMRIAQLLMEDLVYMHKEFRQFYGPEDKSCADWMRWEELEKLPLSLQEIILGKDGAELGGWLALYSTADVKDCIKRVQSLKYAEETCYSGLIVIKAFSSGLDIGTSNWVIKTPKKTVVYLSSSLFISPVAMEFDYNALQGPDIVLYSDFSSLKGAEEDTGHSASNNLNAEGLHIEALADSDECSEEEGRLAFITSCAMDSVKAGGSVLIPIGRIGVVLQFLELLSASQEFTTMKIPMFFISSVAEEFLSLTNRIPEWLCMQRQGKLFAGEPLFAHVDLVKEKKLHVFSSISTPDLLKVWQEPCIVFTPHWSLRLGPAVHFLQRWRGNENSLLILEEGLDADLALLPYQPLGMKVLQCSFLSGIRLSKVKSLLQKMRPKCVLFPAEMSTLVPISDAESFSVTYYSESNILHVPSLKRCAELEIASDLASRLQWINLKEQDVNVTRLKGGLKVEDGKYRLVLDDSCKDSFADPRKLAIALQDMGISTSVEESTNDHLGRAFVLRIVEPTSAVVEVRESIIVINTHDKNLSARIFEAVDTVLRTPSP